MDAIKVSMTQLCDFSADDMKCSRCGFVGPTRDARRVCSTAVRGFVSLASPAIKAADTPPPPPTQGPGTELKKLLSRVGITASPDCSCNARARLMDERGIEWCEQNIDEIVGWLREEASKRGLPFIEMAGRMLVKRAIRNARKATIQ